MELRFVEKFCKWRLFLKNQDPRTTNKMNVVIYVNYIVQEIFLNLHVSHIHNLPYEYFKLTSPRPRPNPSPSPSPSPSPIKKWKREAAFGLSLSLKSSPHSSRTLLRTFLMSVIMIGQVGNSQSYPLHNSKSEFRACPCRPRSGFYNS